MSHRSQKCFQDCFYAVNVQIRSRTAGILLSVVSHLTAKKRGQQKLCGSVVKCFRQTKPKTMWLHRTLYPAHQLWGPQEATTVHKDLSQGDMKANFLFQNYIFFPCTNNRISFNDSQCMKFKVNAMSLILTFIFNNGKID